MIDQTSQESIFRSILRAVYRKFLNRLPPSSKEIVAFIKHGVRYQGTDFTMRFMLFLIRAHVHFAVFKNAAYQEESEWWLIWEGGISHEDNIGFRASQEFLIPYNVLKPKQGPLPITSITVGPRQDAASSVEAVKMALRRFGFGDVPVLDSGIPLREIRAT